MRRLVAAVAIPVVCFAACFSDPAGSVAADAASPIGADASGDTDPDVASRDAHRDLPSDDAGTPDDGATDAPDVCQPSDEVCDGVDDDCDGEVDEDWADLGEPCTVGLGVCAADGVIVCAADGAGTTCDAIEGPQAESEERTCDGLDNDCDGEVDEGCDDDGDGYCDDAFDVVFPGANDTCPNGEGDCRDDDDTIHPGATEVCDGVDNDCDGRVDPDDAFDAYTWYVDCDQDGFAANEVGSRTQCDRPPAGSTGCGGGWTIRRPSGLATTDCDDDDARAFPGQTMYFSTPTNSGVSFQQAWDFNCDGTVEFQYTTTEATCFSCNSQLGDESGWVDANVPSCGVSADFQNCFASGLDCNKEIVSRVQRCR